MDCSLRSVSDETWSRAIAEARSSQNASRSGRGSLNVLLKKGSHRICAVSPHMYFAIALWGSTLPPNPARANVVGAASSKLAPLHEFLSRRAAP